MLPKKFRLSKSGDITVVKRESKITSKRPLFYFIARKTRNKNPRLAVVVPKRLGKAVFRNKLKRRFCGAFMKLVDKLCFSVDMVAYPRAGLATVPFVELVKNLKEAFVSQGMM